MYYFIFTGKYPEVDDSEPVIEVVEEGKAPPPKWMGWKNSSSSQHGDLLAAWEAKNK